MQNSKLSNSVVREYVYDFVPEVLNTNSIFVKVFGKKFAKSRIQSGILIVYTNEDPKKSGYAGCHNGRDKSITICREGKDGNILSPKDILNDEEIEEIMFHESIHAILNRTNKECKKYGIIDGTGILERYKNPRIKVYFGNWKRLK